MKKFTQLFLLFFLFAITLNAQQITVIGIVTDQDEGLPIPGANVYIKGTSTGTITNMDGAYEVNVNGKDTLVFSFIGYENKVVAVNQKTRINVVLVSDVQGLDEVVVVGYGTIRKSDMTGAVSSVRESEEVAAQYSGVDAMLAGRAAGVQVIQQDGNINGAVSVRIRGTNSLRSNNEPLYVIDGVIISSAAEDNASASTDANDMQMEQGGLTGLNMRDIESVEVLKDASATAIYGSRGANGVVIITTKQGKSGKPSVNVYGTYDVAIMSNKLDMLDPIKYAEYQNEHNQLQGFNDKYIISGSDVLMTSDSSLTTQIDWQDEMYNAAHSKSIGFNYSGKNEGTQYYFSANFDDKAGIVENIDVKSAKLRFNFKQEINDWITIDNRISGMLENGSFAKGGSKSGGTRSFNRQVANYRPVYSPVDGDDEELEISNPYTWITDYDDLTEELRFNVSSKLEVKIIEGLKYSLQGGLDYRNKERNMWYGTETYTGSQSNGIARYSDLSRYSYTIDNLLMYNKKINKRHNINAVAGVTYDVSNSVNKIYEVSDFSLHSLRTEYPQGGELVSQPYAFLNLDEKIFSILGRVNYSYRGKYIATASVRRDESSKFTPENRSGIFPSLALAWRINKENFMGGVGFVSDLKLRAGWGQTGNSRIKPYQTIPTYSTNYYVGADGSTILGNSPDRIANSDLTWETTEQINIGIDFGLFENRVTGSIDGYSKTTNDLLQYINIPNSTGFTNMTVNRGSMQNQGIEIALNGVVFDKRDFVIRAGAVFSMNKSQILELGMPSTPIYIDGVESDEIYYLGNTISTGTYFKAPSNIFMEGQAVGMFYGYATNGIIQDSTAASTSPTVFGNVASPGDILFVDQNGDGNIDDADRTIIGDPNPDFSYGFNLDLSYKGLSLTMLFDGVYGNQIVNGFGVEMGYAEGLAKNVFTETYEEAWREDAPSNTYPRVGYRPTSGTGMFIDRQIEDGSFFRLNNVTLGYDIPKDLVPFVNNINIYASVRNAFIITKYTGYNPQITSFVWDGTIQGVDWASSPNVRTFIVGLNVNF